MTDGAYPDRALHDEYGRIVYTADRAQLGPDGKPIYSDAPVAEQEAPVPAIETPAPVGPPPETKISPKVVASAVGAFLVPTLIIVIDYLLGEGRGVFAGLPVILQLVVFSVLTSLGALVPGYFQRDGLRELGAKAMDA